jgi:hypothetical protein
LSQRLGRTEALAAPGGADADAAADAAKAAVEAAKAAKAEAIQALNAAQQQSEEVKARARARATGVPKPTNEPPLNLRDARPRAKGVNVANNNVLERQAPFVAAAAAAKAAAAPKGGRKTPPRRRGRGKTSRKSTFRRHRKH